MNNLQTRTRTKLVVSQSLSILDLIKSQGMYSNKAGISIRVSGRLKGPIAIKTNYNAGHIKTKTFDRVVRMTQDSVRTQVGIIGVRIITG